MIPITVHALNIGKGHSQTTIYFSKSFSRTKRWLVCIVALALGDLQKLLSYPHPISPRTIYKALAGKHDSLIQLVRQSANENCTGTCQ
jgi:hypothetical protein